MSRPASRNDRLTNGMSTDFVKLYAQTTTWGNLVSMARMLPQLRCAWVMSSLDENGLLYDISGQGRSLTPAGGAASPTYGNYGVIPYADFALGSSQYLSRADEAGLDITGSLTVISWVRFDALSTGANTGLISKWYAAGGATQASYRLSKTVTDQLQFSITTDGSTVVSINDAAANYAAATWFYLVGRYSVVQKLLEICVNNTWYQLAVGVPASIHIGTEPLRVASSNRGNYLDGQMAFGAICADSVSNTICRAFYEHTRGAFGV